MLKVCIIDDDPIVIDLLQVVLGELGYAMSSRTSAMGALSWIQSERPDIVLVDLNMPGLPGDEWLDMITQESLIRADEPPSFVIFSSRSRAELERVVRDTCAVGYVQKQGGAEGFGEVFQKIVRGLAS